jgi:hypothetical protein
MNNAAGREAGGRAWLRQAASEPGIVDEETAVILASILASRGEFLAALMPLLDRLSFEDLGVAKEEVAFHRWATTRRAHQSSPLVAAVIRRRLPRQESMTIRDVSDEVFLAAWDIQRQRGMTPLDGKRWRRERDRREGRGPNPTEWPHWR